VKFGSLSRITSGFSRKNGMRTSTFKEPESLAASVRFEKDKMHVRLRDGREISVPLGERIGVSSAKASEFTGPN
jgi:hypothetical protein